MKVNVRNDVWSRIEKVAHCRCFWLGKWTSAAVSLAGCLCACTCASPLISPVSVVIDAESSVAVVAAILAPESIRAVTPREKISIGIDNWDHENFSATEKCMHTRIGVRTLDQSIREKHSRHCRAPLACMLSGIKNNSRHGSSGGSRADSKAKNWSTFERGSHHDNRCDIWSSIFECVESSIDRSKIFEIAEPRIVGDAAFCWRRCETLRLRLHKVIKIFNHHAILKFGSSERGKLLGRDLIIRLSTVDAVRPHVTRKRFHCSHITKRVQADSNNAVGGFADRSLAFKRSGFYVDDGTRCKCENQWQQ